MQIYLIFYILFLSAGTCMAVNFLKKQIQLADLFFVITAARMLWDRHGYLKNMLLKSPFITKFILLILLSLLLISSVLSTDNKRSLIEFFVLFYLVILYLWIVSIDIDASFLKTILITWLFMSVILCVISISGFVSYYIFGENSRFIQFYPDMKSLIPFARLTATFPTMNMFASFLHVGIIFLLVLVVDKQWNLPYIFSASFMILSLFLTASRNLLGIFVSIFLILLPIKARPSLSMFKYVSLILTFVFLSVVLVTTIWCVFPVKIDNDTKNHKLSMVINTAPSLYMVLNRMSIKFIKQRFLVGVGPGMFNRMFIEHLDWDEVRDTYEAKGVADKNASIDPHSTYLGWSAEAGLPFLITVIVLFYSTLRFLWKGYRVAANSFTGKFCYACMCGIIGFMVNGFYIDILTMRHFWLMMGLGAMVSSCLKNQVQPQSQ